MRVALNATALLSSFTGIGQYTYHLAKELQATPGLELDFFYGMRWSKSLRAQPVPGIETIKSMVKQVLPSPYSTLRAIKQYSFSRGISATSPDLYHEPNFLAFKCKKPAIITVHDLSWIRYPHTHPIERVRAMDKYFEPGLRHAALILTDSAFVKRELIEVFGLRPELIMPVPLGVEPLFRPQSAEETLPVLNRHALLHGRYLLAVGTLEPRKNLQVALQAFSQLPAAIRKHYPLVLVGMKGWHTAALEQQMAPMIGAGEVRQLGYLSREELAAVIAGAVTLIYPSLYEGFGLPPLEAMACGVPVIAADASSLPEVVGETGLLINPHHTEAITQAMELLVTDATTRHTLSVKALERSKKFSWEHCARQTTDAYRQVLRTEG